MGGTPCGLAINDSGQVTGFADTAAEGVAHAFLWDGTTVRDLGTLGGSESQGVAINASGQVTGGAETAEGIATPSYGTARRCWTSAR